MRSIAGHNLIDPLSLDLPGSFHVTFLRDPVARFMSHYFDWVSKTAGASTIREFLDQNEWLHNIHVKLMAGESNLDKAKRYLERCDFVGLTEKFDLSLHALEKIAPCRLDWRYNRRRVTPPSSDRKSAAKDPALVELVRERNQLDLAVYDFAAKEIFPKLCEKAGLKPDAPVASLDLYGTCRHWRYQVGRFYNRAIYRQACKLFRR